MKNTKEIKVRKGTKAKPTVKHKDRKKESKKRGDYTEYSPHGGEA